MKRYSLKVKGHFVKTVFQKVLRITLWGMHACRCASTMTVLRWGSQTEFTGNAKVFRFQMSISEIIAPHITMMHVSIQPLRKCNARTIRVDGKICSSSILYYIILCVFIFTILLYYALRRVIDRLIKKIVLCRILYTFIFHFMCKCFFFNVELLLRLNVII